MEISGVQGDTQTSNYQQQQQAKQVLEQQSTVISEATVNSSAALQVYKQQSREQSAPVDTVQLKATSTLKNLDTVKAIEQMHIRLNDLVKGVRQSNEALNTAVEQVSEMQGNLMAIVKNYPPYPIESMERRELLMSYMSLRKEIESLMLPPPPQPVFEKVRSMWEAMFSSNGQLQASAVPALDAGSGDKQVQEAAAQLGKLGEQFSALSDTITQSLFNS
jgi:hypothetical protein